jgi:hypothetical protein
MAGGPSWVIFDQDEVGRRSRNVGYAPKAEVKQGIGELTDDEWATIKPMPPNKPRGIPATWFLRCDKLAANYLAFIQLASIRLWLRVNGSTP